MNEVVYKVKRYFAPKLIKGKEYISFLRNKGIKIGEGTIIYNASTVTIDESRPHLLEIGEFCKITGGCIILAHDYSRSVLRRKYGEIIAEADKTIIGDNVFIGMNSVILMGTKVGNNTIIGAGSIVAGTFPDDVVIAGNPAKVITSLTAFYEKRKKGLIDAACIFYTEFSNTFRRNPTIEEMDSFFPLYLDRDMKELRKHNIRTKLGGDNEDEIINSFLETEKIFDDYESFKNYCNNRKESNSTKQYQKKH